MSLKIAERHRYILNLINEEGVVNVQDLSKKLKVSSVTIRKDLKVLEDRNLLFRTHGSATLKNPYINERPVNEKEKIHAEEKLRIAKRATTLLEPHDSIIIASGTSVIEFAKQIDHHLELTVLTASLNAASALVNSQNIEVIQLGGSVRRSSSSVIGPFAENMLSEFTCNKLFIGVDGIDISFGLTTTSSMEASLNKAMLKVAQKVIILADSSKFGRRGFGRICGLEKVDILVTDSGIDTRFKSQIEEFGIKVIVT